jgi:hypothetical protein
VSVREGGKLLKLPVLVCVFVCVLCIYNGGELCVFSVPISEMYHAENSTASGL